MKGYTSPGGWDATTNGRGPATYAEFRQVVDYLHSKGDTRTFEEIMDQAVQSRLDSIAEELVEAAVKYNADVRENGLVEASDTPVLVILSSLHTLSVMGYAVNTNLDGDVYTSIEINGKAYPVGSNSNAG